jgi:hypothetical protein
MLYKIYDIFQKYVNTFTRYLNWCDYFKVLATHEGKKKAKDEGLVITSASLLI